MSAAFITKRHRATHPVKGKHTYRDTHHRIRNKQLLLPMQHRTPVVMPPALHNRHTRQHLLCPPERLPHPLLILAVHPLCVISRYIHWTPKLRSPLEMGRVEVRVANHNSLQSALAVDELHSLVIKEGNQVPEDITMRCFKQDCALTYAELLPGCAAVGQARGQFRVGQGLGGYVVDAGIVGIGLKFVFLCALGGVEGRPGLAVGGDVLTRVLVGLEFQW